MKNTHKGHTASCLCCQRFCFGYEGDYSDLTPGAGLEILCFERKFFYQGSEAEEVSLHEVVMQGETCEVFEERR